MWEQRIVIMGVVWMTWCCAFKHNNESNFLLFIQLEVIDADEIELSMHFLMVYHRFIHDLFSYSSHHKLQWEWKKGDWV